MSGVDPETTPLIYNALIGTKFKIVNGYNGTTDIALAMERREVDGIGDWSWSSLKMSRPDWLKDQRVHILLQGALTKKSRIAERPLCSRLRERRFGSASLQALFFSERSSTSGRGSSWYPARTVAGAACRIHANGPDFEFQNDAEKSKLLVDPAPGSSVQDIVSMIASAPGPVAKRLLDILSPSR